MYKVILYGENAATSKPIEVKVKSRKEPVINDGVLSFYNAEVKVAEFSIGSWQYWKKIDEEN